MLLGPPALSPASPHAASARGAPLSAAAYRREPARRFTGGREGIEMTVQQMTSASNSTPQVPATKNEKSFGKTAPVFRGRGNLWGRLHARRRKIAPVGPQRKTQRCPRKKPLSPHSPPLGFGPRRAPLMQRPHRLRRFAGPQSAQSSGKSPLVVRGQASFCGVVRVSQRPQNEGNASARERPLLRAPRPISMGGARLLSSATVWRIRKCAALYFCFWRAC